MENSVIKRIDDLGRVTVPREFRLKLGIYDQGPVTVELVDDGILIKPCSKVEGLRLYLDNLRGAIRELEWVSEDDKDRLLEKEAAFEAEIRSIENLYRPGPEKG